jgi:hypothetical protein
LGPKDLGPHFALPMPALWWFPKCSISHNFSTLAYTRNKPSTVRLCLWLTMVWLWCSDAYVLTFSISRVLGWGSSGTLGREFPTSWGVQQAYQNFQNRSNYRILQFFPTVNCIRATAQGVTVVRLRDHDTFSYHKPCIEGWGHKPHTRTSLLRWGETHVSTNYLRMLFRERTVGVRRLTASRIIVMYCPFVIPQSYNLFLHFVTLPIR